MTHSLWLAIAIPSFLIGPLSSFIIPAISGTVTSYAYAQVKKAAAWVDALPPQIHVTAVTVIAFALSQVGKLVPGFTATDLGGISPDAVSGLVALAMSQLTHALTAKK